ncbi:anti-sigma factor antagonist [Streptomyces sp. NBC_01288]|uniref:anti-sigma factor antagonist n=1 Tax=Streptomyces sp. NBC_01288 TaxID=2903814 RepID=UPI002E0D86C8|nr:anti-sigma factor antagonist [Streptomyces sp. NBC_01288]WSL06645.1 anti-sigma factor antagonist [Streptomyces sp. NBC_01288]
MVAPSAFLEIVTHPAGNRTVVTVSGEIDIDTEQTMQQALRLALARSPAGVDLDLTGVGFCDCSGLNVLLRVRRLALEDGKTIGVRALSPWVERLFALTDTSSLFTHARAPVNGFAHEWHEHLAATHDLMEENGVSDEAEELRVEVVQLKRAMLTRPVIDLARGVLMASFGLSPEDAWSVLVDVSQHTNTKLHQLAEDLVDSVNGPPLPDHLHQRITTAITEISRPA